MGDELDNWEQPPVVPSGEEKVEYHFELDSGDSGWVVGSLSMFKLLVPVALHTSGICATLKKKK